MSSQAALTSSKLLQELLTGRTSVVDFCDRFETIWTFEIDRSRLTPLEEAALGALFEVVAWYSPFEQERLEVPNYTGEVEVRRAAQTAGIALGVYEIIGDGNGIKGNGVSHP